VLAADVDYSQGWFGWMRSCYQLDLIRDFTYCT
jgi:hypothetical protein